MEKPDLTKLSPSYWDVLLPTGRAISLSQVEFDRVRKRFYYGPLDVTDYLLRAQKNAFRSYDPTEDNIRLSDAHQRALGKEPVQVGSTSVWENFVGNVAHDLSGVTRFAAGTGVGFNLRTVVTLGFIAAALFFGWQFVKTLKP